MPRGDRLSLGEVGETEQCLGRPLVRLVGRDRSGGIGSGVAVLRLNEELDECGRDLARRSLDRQADAGTELDDAPGVEQLVASKREQEKGFPVDESPQRRAQPAVGDDRCAAWEQVIVIGVGTRLDVGWGADRLSAHCRSQGEDCVHSLTADRVADARPAARTRSEEVAVPLRIRSGGSVLSFISTITTFARATDITVAELSIESFYPTDSATAEALRAFAATQS